MKRTLISPLGATILLLIFLSSALAARPWLVNINGDLETNNADTPPFANVLINSALGVNLGTASSLLLPAVPGGAPATTYPLAVNGTLAMWDPFDGLRSIIGLSEFGALGIFSGSNGTDGAGLVLCPPASLFFPGQAIMISNGVPGTACLSAL